MNTENVLRAAAPAAPEQAVQEGWKLDAEREFLEDWLSLAAEPIGMDCCGQPTVGAQYMGANEMVCCGNGEPAYIGFAAFVDAMEARHRAVVAELTAAPVPLVPAPAEADQPHVARQAQAAPVESVLDDSHLHSIVTRIIKGAYAQDGHQYCRENFVELCEFIDNRVTKAASLAAPTLGSAPQAEIPSNAPAAFAKRYAELFAENLKLKALVAKTEPQAERVAVPATHEGRQAFVRDFGGPPMVNAVLRGKLSLNDAVALVAAAPVAQEVEPGSVQAELAEMEARKDVAYLERNQVVAALAKCFPSGVARTAIKGWSEDWHGCVYIDLPTGQASWHFHDSQAYLFDGLPAYEGVWDGHDTPEKYSRLASLAVQAQAAPNEAREQALEEAAQLFDRSPHAEEFRSDIAEQIRALKVAAPSSTGAAAQAAPAAPQAAPDTQELAERIKQEVFGRLRLRGLLNDLTHSAVRILAYELLDDLNRVLCDHAPTAIAKPDIAAMVNRFLGWKLPKDFYPDCGITFKHNETWGAYPNNWPIGTNLFTADQAKAMFEYVLASPVAAPEAKDGLMRCGVCGDGQLYCNGCGTGFAIPVAAPEAPLCQWPTCQPEEVQQQVAQEVLESTYGAAPEAPASERERIQRIAELHFYQPDAKDMDERLYRFACALLASPAATTASEDTAEFLVTLQGAAKEATDEWIAGFVRQHFGIYKATTASASDVQAEFESWTNSHGGLPLDRAGDHLKTDDGLLHFPTYKFGRTEIAWRAWANRRAPAPSREAAPLDLSGVPTYDPDRDNPGLMELRDKYNDGDHYKVEDLRAALAQQGAAQPCPHCDDTGDVHRADGEWMGECSCGAAQAAHAGANTERLQAEVERLTALLNTPETLDFIKGLQLETAHQRERWSVSHDAGKAPADWFWLIGYLAQKAMMSHLTGDTDKALHHTITTAAALANWHAAILGKNDMRPGIAPPVEVAMSAATEKEPK